MSKKKEKHLCDECGKDFEELVSRQSFIMMFGVDFVCHGCFAKLEGCEFEDYGKKEKNDSTEGSE